MKILIISTQLEIQMFNIRFVQVIRFYDVHQHQMDYKSLAIKVLNIT